MCVCTPEVKTPFCGAPGCGWPLPTTLTEAAALGAGVLTMPSVLIKPRRPALALEALQVAALRRAMNRPYWRQTLPAWIAAAIGDRIIGIHWERTEVEGKSASADDWIVRMPDGSLVVQTPEAFAAVYEVC